MSEDYVVGMAFPDAVPASSTVEKNDMTYRRSSQLELTGIAVTYPKNFGAARITLELQDYKVFEDVPLAAVGSPHDGDVSYSSRPCRYILPGGFRVKAKIQNTTNQQLAAGDVSIIFYSNTKGRRE